MKDYILCAIDFSDSSLNSLQWANKLARGTGAHLAVLYSYRLIQTGRVADILSFKRKTEEECKSRFLQLEESVPESKNVPASFITEIGFFSDNIENFIRKNPSSIVVLSEVLANVIYEHKGQTLSQFLKAIRVPLVIVPNFRDLPMDTPSTIDRQAVSGTVAI